MFKLAVVSLGFKVVIKFEFEGKNVANCIWPGAENIFEYGIVEFCDAL